MRYKKAITTVEFGIDRYLAGAKGKGFDPDGVKASTLAKLASTTRTIISNSDMSFMLQQYRKAQALGTTKYIIAAEGYGPNGRWKILAKPGSHQATVQRNRTKHAKFVAGDMAARMTSDLVHEVRPGLDATSIADAEIARVMTLVESQVAALIAFVDATLP